MDPESPEDRLLLEGFQVRMYRTIRDSGFVPVFPLTALVGRRQSGKTSLLRALHGIDSALPEPFSLAQDWPRDRRHLRTADQVVCAATFRFGPAAREELLREGVVETELHGVRIGRTYAGALVVESWSGQPSGELSADFNGNGSKNGAPPAPASPALAAFARESLPPILYAESDALLPGAVSSEDLAAPRASDEETGVAALARLLAAVGVGPDELRHELTSRRVREAGEQLRARLEEHGRSHDLALDVDRGRVRIFLHSSGRRLTVAELPPEVRYRLTLDLRLAAARELHRGRPLLLLDGPGRKFRGRFRPQMRTMLEEFVRQGATVLYTARLPFEIELQHSEQVLVLASVADGSTVACPARDADHDLAIRAALGMSGRASFRVDDLNLIVEGQSDVEILQALDGLLRRSGEPALPPDVTPISVGGSHEVAAVAQFLGRQGLGVIGLLDSDAAGVTAHRAFRHTLERDPRMRRVKVLLLASAAELDVANAVIEDLFPGGFYLDAALETCGLEAHALITRIAAGNGVNLEGAAGSLASRLVKAFEAKGQRFPKARVTEALATRIAGMTSVAELPPGVAEPVRRLMEAIRAAADRYRIASCN